MDTTDPIPFFFIFKTRTVAAGFCQGLELSEAFHNANCLSSNSNDAATIHGLIGGINSELVRETLVEDVDYLWISRESLKNQPFVQFLYGFVGKLASKNSAAEPIQPLNCRYHRYHESAGVISIIHGSSYINRS